MNKYGNVIGQVSNKCGYDAINVRSTREIRNNNVIGRVTTNDEFYILKRYVGWMMIQKGNLKGFMKSKINGEGTVTSPAQISRNCGYDLINVRSSREIRCNNVVTHFKPGKAFYIIFSDEDWCYITDRTTTGYIKKFYHGRQLIERYVPVFIRQKSSPPVKKKKKKKFKMPERKCGCCFRTLGKRNECHYCGWGFGY